MSLFSCRRFTERAVRNLDEPLTGWNRFAYLFHYYWCYICRRLEQQIIFLETTLKELAKREDADEILSGAKGKDSLQLSAETAEKIKQSLNKG